jgi:hypothetical protein
VKALWNWYRSLPWWLNIALGLAVAWFIRELFRRRDGTFRDAAHEAKCGVCADLTDYERTTQFWKDYCADCP